MEILDQDKIMSSTLQPVNDDAESIVNEYKRVCRWVRQGINFDMQKAFVDGKPVILEGFHLAPDYLLRISDDNRYEI